MSMASSLAHYGFDSERLKFGARTGLAACLALLVAWLLGLEHPQWSAMTVWAASQPVPALLKEKSLFRALGTVVGTVFGIALVLVAGGNTLILVIGLAIWVGLCAGAGNALGGLIAYGALLSGYSASMVALLNTAGSGNIFALGADRFATVLVGILVALAVGLLFGPGETEDELGGRTRRMVALVLHQLASQLGYHPKRPDRTLSHTLSEIADIESRLEAHSAGSLRSRRSAHSLHASLTALVAAILWIKNRDGQLSPDNQPVADALRRAAEALEASASLEHAIVPLKEALALCENTGGLKDILTQITEAIQARAVFRERGASSPGLKRRIILHRDWVYARQAMIRTTVMLLLVGGFWVVSDWDAGAYVLLGTSVMVTLFSTFENPAWIMRNILLWQIVGATAAVACRWLLWPMAETELQMLLMMAPFILIGAVAFAHPRVAPGSVDYNMVFLLLSQPVLPLVGSFSASVAIALAVVMGPLLAYIAFRVMFPTDLVRQKQRLQTMMVREIQSLAADPRAQARQEVWQARLYHRAMKLVQLANRTGQATRPAARASLAVLRLGNAAIRLQAMRQDPGLSGSLKRGVEVALLRLQTVQESPGKAARSLQNLARKLEPVEPGFAQELVSLAQNLAEHPAVFQK